MCGSNSDPRAAFNTSQKRPGTNDESGLEPSASRSCIQPPSPSISSVQRTVDSLNQLRQKQAYQENALREMKEALETASELPPNFRFPAKSPYDISRAVDENLNDQEK